MDQRLQAALDSYDVERGKIVAALDEIRAEVFGDAEALSRVNDLRQQVDQQRAVITSAQMANAELRAQVAQLTPPTDASKLELMFWHAHRMAEHLAAMEQLKEED